MLQGIYLSCLGSKGSLMTEFAPHWSMAEPAGSSSTAPETERGVSPTWDLSDLFAGIDDPAIEAALIAAGKDAEAIAETYAGTLGERSGDELALMLERYETVEETLGRVYAFASLSHAANRDDPKIGRFMQGVQERVNAITTHLLFVTLELNRIDDAALSREARGIANAAEPPALARQCPSFSPASALRRDREGAARALGHRPQRLGAAVRREHVRLALSVSRRGADQRADLRQDVGEGPRRSPRRSRSASAAFSPAISASAAASPTRSSRTRPSRTAGATSRGRSRRAISPTRSRTRWSTRSSPRCATPIPGCRIATTRSRRAGWGSTSWSSGTATRRCPRIATNGGAGPMPRSSCSTPTARSRRRWPRWSTDSSSATGSTPRSGPARTAAPFAIRSCPACTPTC